MPSTTAAAAAATTPAISASTNRARPPATPVRHIEAAGEHQVIMAERFKTKLCRTYQQTGACPYEFKCMFAHGPEELRSQTDNERDGLTSEEAVKLWQRARRLAKAEAAGIETPCSPASQQTKTPTTTTSDWIPSPTIPKPRSRQLGMSLLRPAPTIPTATDVVVKETEYRNLTPVCAAWVSALLTPASPSAGGPWHGHMHSEHDAMYCLVPVVPADAYFQSNGGLIG